MSTGQVLEYSFTSAFLVTLIRWSERADSSYETTTSRGRGSQQGRNRSLRGAVCSEVAGSGWEPVSSRGRECSRHGDRCEPNSLQRLFHNVPGSALCVSYGSV